MKCPTGDQCNQNSLVHETDAEDSYACWYPQMGGYASRAVVTFPKMTVAVRKALNDDGLPCFDMLIWHDGEFPFDDEPFRPGDTVRAPTELHHCDAEQFIEFGNTVKTLQEKHR